MKTTSKTIALLISTCVGAFASLADITTGWLQTAAGTGYLFSDSGNWYEGEPNGVFSENWTPAGSQTIKLTSDWSGTLKFLGNNAYEVTFVGRNDADTKTEKRTIYLTDDLVAKPLTGTKGKIIFDGTNRNIDFDLGGVNRSFLLYDPAIPDRFRFAGQIKNGDLTLDGDGGGLMLLGTAAAVQGNVTVRPNMTLEFNFPNTSVEIERAKDITLYRSTLAFKGHNYEAIANVGRITVAAEGAPCVSFLTSEHNTAHSSTLNAKSLVLEDGAALAVVANNLGASGATGKDCIKLDVVPSFAGDVTYKLLPGIVAVTNTKASFSGAYGYGPFLTTYDEEYGIRPLDDATETSTEISSERPVNLVIGKAETLNVPGEATVNSIQMRTTAYNDGSQTLSGTEKLTVKSGMIAINCPKSCNVDIPLDFDEARGYFIAFTAHNYPVNIKKPIYGSNGIVFTKVQSPSQMMQVEDPIYSNRTQGYVITAAGGDDAYTGDTYIQCVVNLKDSSGFLPHGTREGNVFVRGTLYTGTTSVAMNGLFGDGYVQGTTSGANASTITIGEDGSDGDYKGTIEAPTVCKTGAGVQRFAGTLGLGTALDVNGGMVVLDGAVTQGAVNVAANAAIGGAGGITNNLAFAEGAKLAVKVVDGVASCLNVAGAATGGPVTVNATVEGGKWRTEQCVLTSGTSMGEMTFVKGDGVGSLELRNNGAELWASPKVSGLTIVLR